ncbi:MAG: M15 family metallopeptidase [Candidatus Saccharimonadales bacterium]
MTRKKASIILGSLLLLAGLGAAIYLIVRHEINKPVPVTQEVKQTTPTEPTLFTFDKNRYPTDQADSPWVVVNKANPLLSSYIPSDLIEVRGSQMRSQAAADIEKLITAAGKEQIVFRVISGYRSFETQHNVYSAYVAKDGRNAADTYSARPGHSEHQTGLAADIGNGSGKCDLDICFAATPGGKWITANAHTYGFIIRYADNKTSITGFQYEPWHLRYVGVDLANELRTKNQTMEEFFNLPAAPNY